jgi:hypothetical protein
VKYLVANRWYVTIEDPHTGRIKRPGTPSRRKTKSFPIEIEAKLFAKAMLTDGLKVIIAGTLSPHQPTRRLIAPSAILDWIEEPEH